MKILNPILMLFTLAAIVSCGKNEEDKIYQGGYDTAYPISDDARREIKRGRITGDDGIDLLGLNKKGGGRDLRGDSIAHGVNTYLWQASLDVISFMPIAAVDATGGVIITDWYQDPNAKGEQIKANIVVSSDELRANGVRVTLFRQVGGKSVAANNEVARKLEDKILARAREIKIEKDRF